MIPMQQNPPPPIDFSIKQSPGINLPGELFFRYFLSSGSFKSVLIWVVEIPSVRGR